MIVLAQPPTPTAATKLQMSIDFAGGSGAADIIDHEQRLVRLSPTAHKDRGWECWWYVKISGIKRGETIAIDVGEAPWATPDRAAYSLDQKTWMQTGPGVRSGRRIVYKQQVDGEQAWFAWGPAFTQEDAAALVRAAAGSCSDASAFELCRTRGGRTVPALEVKQPEADDEQRVSVWIQARQHAWESGSSWVCRGLTEWLVSDDPRAVSLRGRADVTIVPVMDVDNVAIGAGGKNQVPQDHNRDWSDQPHWRSVAAAMQRIKRLDEQGRLAMFIDLHNPGANARRPFYYITPRNRLSDIGQRNLDRFLAASRLEMTGPLSFVGETHESGPQYDRQWQAISKNWVSMHSRPHVTAVTLETAWNTPNSTTAGYRTVGRQLGLAIERHLRSQPLAAE